MVFNKMCLFFAMFLLVSYIACSSLEVNEVMYAPSEAAGGAGNEWVELTVLGNQSVNASFCTLDGEHFLSGLMEPASLAVLAKNEALFHQQYPEVPSIIIPLSLKNEGDDIILNCSGHSQKVSYHKRDGAYRNNKTLERRADGSWGESLADFGTPGIANSITNLSLVYEPLFISEMYPDPFGADDAFKPQGEWIELQNDGLRPIWLGGLYFTSDREDEELFITDSNTLEDLILDPDEYIVIYRDGDSDFALNNDLSQVVRLWAGDELVHEVSYTGSTTGMTWSNIEGDFYLTPPTPGEINEFFEDCDWLLEMEMNSSIVRPEEFIVEVTASRFVGIPQNISVRGTIEDEFGRIIREYAPWTGDRINDQQTKIYSPNLGEGIYQVRFWFSLLECTDVDESDNNITRIVVVNPQYRASGSSLVIEGWSLPSDKAAWGEQIRVQVRAYKGDSSRKVISLWAEQGGKKVSRETTFSLDEKFKNLSLTLPVQLLEVCDVQGKDGKATLVVEGLGERAERSLEITGAEDVTCRAASSESSSAKFSLEVIPLPSRASPGSVVPVTVIIQGDGKLHSLEAWVFAYRGSKCYSCQGKERDANMQRRQISANGLETFSFPLVLDEEMEDGEYKVKVQVRKDGQKTLREATTTFQVEHSSLVPSSANGSSPSSLLLAQQPSLGFGNALFQYQKRLFSSGIVVYESNSEKAGRLAPYILGAALVMLIIVVIVKKDV